MLAAEKKITIGENTVQRNKSVANILALALRYYVHYRMGDEQSLNKAYRVVQPALEENPSAVWLFYANVFFQIEMNSIEKADEAIFDFKQFRNYYKNGYPLAYAMYLYLNIILDIRYEKERSARKQLKRLMDLVTKGDLNLPYVDIMAADINIRLKNYGQALDNLEYAYEAGCRSPLLYCALSDIYKSGYIPGETFLLTPLIRWLWRQGYLKEYLVEENPQAAPADLSAGSLLFEEIYEKFPSEWLLRDICTDKMRKGDFSLHAYRYYSEAVKLQLDISGLSECVIKTGFINRLEDISRYTMARFLNRGEIDIDMMPYVYHLLLSQEALSGLVEEQGLHLSIMKFAAYCLTNKAEGRYYNSIYRYALDYFDSDSAPLKQYAEKILYKSLFAYTLKIDETLSATAYVAEKEKTDMIVARFHVGSLTINSPSGNFETVVMDSGTKTVLNIRPQVLREVANGDTALYEYFFARGYRDPELLTALAYEYTKMECPPDKAVDVLKKALGLPNLSMPFRIKISAALGNVLSSQDKFEQALEYYNEVNENFLDEKLIEMMLTAFINAGEYQKAVNLIVRKRAYISGRTLFVALKKLARIETFQPVIADAAYELLLNSWYDSEFLDIVLKYYNASQHEWQQLSEALSGVSVQDTRLDEIIIENSIWMHDFSESSQRTFKRLYKNAPENPFIDEFAYYAAYEMLVNHTRPEYETLSTLEKIYRRKPQKDKLTAYALCAVFLRYSIQSIHSDEILKDAVSFMEEDGFMLPEIKEIKDKTILTPYIEKNQPFIYQCSADKKVFLNYRFDEEDDFEKKEMRYLRFGIFYYVMPVFYDEKITYYFTEEMARGSIATREFTLTNTRVNINNDSNDIYYLINNALIYDRMFKYSDAEKIITGLLRQGPAIKGEII